MNETITPTYEEGVRRGRAEEARLAEATRLGDVFARDEAHARTLRDLATTIRYGLGQVASCDSEYEAMRLAKDLVASLDRLVDHYDSQKVAHRDDAQRLREGS